MINFEKKNFWLIGLIVTVVSFIMLLVGIKIVLGNELVPRNLVAFSGFSVLAGLIALLSVYFRLKIAFLLFIVGLAIGFFEMYRAFIGGMSGWGDLIGIISLFMWALIGIGMGIIIQLGFYVYKRYKKR